MAVEQSLGVTGLDAAVGGRRPTPLCQIRVIGYIIYPNNFGGVLASTWSLKRRRHVEDGSLASLKTEPKKINADHQDLALAA